MSDKKSGDGLVIGILLVLILMLVVVGGGGAAFWFMTEMQAQGQAEDQRQRAMENLQISLEAQAIAEQMKAAEQDGESEDALPNEDAPGPGETESTPPEYGSMRIRLRNC